MNIKTTILFLIITAVLPIPLRAQQKASISGFVKDKTSGETLIGANIALDTTGYGASTNSSGYYTLTSIPPGNYTLLCSYIGYHKYFKEINVSPGEHLRLDIDMTPANIQMSEVVVESKAEKEEQKNIGTAQIQTKLIKELPSVFESDVFRSIQLLPGVKASSDFSSGLYIRGGGPDQTLILLDGTTVYNPTHFFGFFSTFNPDAIKDVKLYKGGYPAKYGGRLGSVLDIHNKDGNRKHFESTLSLGLLASRISFEGPYSKGSWMLAFRRSTLEPALAVLRKTQDNIPNSFYFYDVNGKLNFDADQNDKLSLALYSGVDNVDLPFATDGNIYLNYGNQTISSKWTHIFSQKVFGHFTVTGSRYFNFPSFNIAGTPYKRSNNVYDFSVKGDLQFIPNQHHLVETGFWGGNITLKLQDNFDNQDVFGSRIKSLYGSYYLQDTWTPTDKWKIIGGIRANLFAEGHYYRLAPRLSLQYKPVDGIRLQAAYGRYDQFLTLVTNEAFSGFDVWLTTGKGVKPEWGDQYVTGIKTTPFKNIDLDVETYYRTMNDLFDLNPFIPDPAGLDYSQLFRFGKGYAYGAEFKLEKTEGRLSGFIGYTYSVTRRKYPSFNQDRFFPPKYDRSNDVDLVLNLQLSKRWKATAVYKYATGQAFTKPLGRTVFLTPFDSEYRDVLTVGRVNASRLPAYNRLDLGFARSGTFFGTGNAEWKLQVINVYSRRNIWFYQYDFNKNPVKRNQVTLLPILPSLSYTIKF
ncbi:MAG TPA: TonB-dependent receptor [Balneolales bacterium]|nr:TonB-dependent receptor [Balneolales bacterium]